MEIAKAMVNAQGRMAGVRKNATNPAFRSTYADLAAVVEAVIPALQEAGIAVIQGAASSFDSAGVVVTVETMLLHTSGQWLKSELGLHPTKADPQGIGSAITYGRRYLLLAMCGVAPEDDDGNAASGKPAGRSSVPAAAKAGAPASAASESLAGSGRPKWLEKLVVAAQKLPPAEVRAICDEILGEGVGILNTPDRDTGALVYIAIQQALQHLSGAA